jgi:hypothetical protein
MCYRRRGKSFLSLLWAALGLSDQDLRASFMREEVNRNGRVFMRRTLFRADPARKDFLDHRRMFFSAGSTAHVDSDAPNCRSEVLRGDRRSVPDASEYLSQNNAKQSEAGSIEPASPKQITI